MDRRMRGLYFEVVLAIGGIILVFNTGILAPDLSNPVALFFIIAFLVESFRILIKLRRMRLQGIDIDAEGRKSPILYSVNPKIAQMDYSWKTKTVPIQRATGVVFTVMALVVVAFIIIAILEK